MFTGLIETIGTVKSIHQDPAAMRLAVDLGELADEAKIGDSIAINGACLTITKLVGSKAVFDVSAETLKKTALSKLKPASKVNVERAIKAGDRFGGHFVLGHIDGTAAITSIERQGRFTKMVFTADTELLVQMVIKGSVAVDGISLTIADMDSKSFTVVLIPQTLNETTLGQAKIADVVNIETDIIVKAVKKQLENIEPKAQKLSIDKLKELGF